MIKEYLISEFYYTATLNEANLVTTNINLLRDHEVVVTLDNSIVKPSEYGISIDSVTERVVIYFNRKRSGDLNVVRVSNTQSLLGLGTEKSREQNEKFFDKLVQFAQDEARARQSKTTDANMFNISDIASISEEGKKTRIYKKAYKEFINFKFKINGYNEDIRLDLPNSGSFGGDIKNIIPVTPATRYIQDVETGISKYGLGYTLIKSVTWNGREITELVLYRRIMNNKADKYNVQKAMIGTTSKKARIILGNTTYNCSVIHKYDSITLTPTTKIEEYESVNSIVRSSNLYIDLDGYSVPLYIQNNGMTMNGYA